MEPLGETVTIAVLGSVHSVDIALRSCVILQHVLDFAISRWEEFLIKVSKIIHMLYITLVPTELKFRPTFLSCAPELELFSVQLVLYFAL